MKRTLACMAAFTVAILLLAGTVYAAPNLTGEWKLSLAKSDYGAFPSPLAMTRTVTHNGINLALHSVQKSAQGEVTSDYKYTTDGKESVNKVQGGESRGTAQWIGDKLMIENAREFQGVTLKEKQIWTLSPDGKTLTIDSHVTVPNGEFDVKQVFEK